MRYTIVALSLLALTTTATAQEKVVRFTSQELVDLKRAVALCVAAEVAVSDKRLHASWQALLERFEFVDEYSKVERKQ